MDKIPSFVLRLHFGALIYKTVNILPQTLPLGVGLRLRQMLDGQGIIQKKAEAEDPTVYKIIHILTSGYKGIKGYTLEKLSVQDHGSAEGKGCALEPRSAADDLVKGARLAAEAVPIGHPRLRSYIVIILPFAVEIVAGNSVHDVSVNSSAQKFQ